jgi:ankyrin repeat protein
MLIDANAAINQGTIDKGLTPLYMASGEGHLEVVRVLLDANAAVNQGTIDNGITPLCMASYAGRLEVVRLLLHANAAVDQETTDAFLTPLCMASYAGRLEVVQCLLDANAAVNHGPGEVSPLMAASTKGHEVTVRTLLESNADVGYRSTNGTSAVSVAARFGHLDAVKLLIGVSGHENDPSWKESDSAGMTPLHYATARGHDAVVEFLRGAGRVRSPSNGVTNTSHP